MSSVVISGNTSGTITLDAPAVAGTTTLTLPATSGTVVTKDTNGIISVNGVQFPATQSPSADANCLDDYEEGTWTPTAGGTSTYSLQSGQYIKIGKLVYINGVVIFTALGTGSNLNLSGLPFTDGNVGGVKSGSVSNFSGVATNVTSIFPGVGAGSATIDFRSTTGAASNIGISAIFGNSTRIDFNAFYFIS
jgi:hypothetical protein